MMQRWMKNIAYMASLGIMVGLIGCKQEESTPVAPASEQETTTNYYVSRGLQDGLINGVLLESVGIITLPAGTWRIRYLVNSHWWQIVARSQKQGCHYIGTHEAMTSVLVQEGTHPSLLEEGLLEPVTEIESEWQALPESKERWIFENGALASWILPMDRQDFCPEGTPAVIVPPVMPPTCKGVPSQGGCWYLSGVNATCQATCQAQGLAVDTTIDSDDNFFWSAPSHDAAYCRSLLTQLQHPNINSSTLSFSAANGYGLCGASDDGVVIKHFGGRQDATHPFANGQVACPCL